MPSVCFNRVRLNMLSPTRALTICAPRSISPGYIYSKGVISKGALGASAERLDAITPPPFSRPIVHQW